MPEATVKKVAKDKATFSPIVTLEPRRRRFHQPVTLTMPLPPPLPTAAESAAEPFDNEVDPDNLRLLCSLTGKHRRTIVMLYVDYFTGTAESIITPAWLGRSRPSVY